MIPCPEGLADPRMCVACRRNQLAGPLHAAGFAVLPLTDLAQLLVALTGDQPVDAGLLERTRQALTPPPSGGPAGNRLPQADHNGDHVSDHLHEVTRPPPREDDHDPD